MTRAPGVRFTVDDLIALGFLDATLADGVLRLRFHNRTETWVALGTDESPTSPEILRLRGRRYQLVTSGLETVQ